MNFTPLAPEQREHFREHGYLIVKNALDDDLRNCVVAVGDRFMETAGPIHNYYANRYIDLAQDDALVELTTNSRTVPLVVQLLSYNIHLMRGHLIYKYPQAASDEPIYPDGDGRSFRNWHRDLNNFTPDHPIRGTVAIRVGYCLTDFPSPDAGVTMLVPGSHKLNEALKFKKGALDPPKFIEPALEAGDAYIFSTSTYHTPAVNFTPETTKVLLVSYAYRWWAQQHPTPPDEVLANMDPITAQLFCQPLEGDDVPLRAWATEHGLPVEDPPMRVFE